jgi:osmotically-inducible protein OsmY
MGRGFEGGYQGGGMGRGYQGGMSRDYEGGYQGGGYQGGGQGRDFGGGYQGGGQGRGFEGGGMHRGYEGMNRGFEGQGGTSGQQTGRGQGPRGYKRSDERIQEDICDRLMHQDQVDVSDVEIKVNGGEVTLTGTVANRQIKHMVENLADAVGGVTEVHNQLRIKRDDRQRGTSDDKSLQGGQSGQTGQTGQTAKTGQEGTGSKTEQKGQLTSTSETKNNEGRNQSRPSS